MAKNSFNTKSTLSAGERSFTFFKINELKKSGMPHIDRLPFTFKILLENLLRHEDGVNVTAEDIKAVATWAPGARDRKEISFMPARVILQDFTGVPGVVDLASLRDAALSLGIDPQRINPQQRVDLVIDHSVQIDHYGTAESFKKNVEIEFQRNRERYSFLRWGQRAFKNFRVVPPGTGIVHQVNLEYLAEVIFQQEIDGEHLAYPDTLLGTDSHTTMINGLGILGWGVGGIEAEAAMLGQPISMLLPEVVGFKLTGRLPEGTTATDLVLTVTQNLRKKGVVGKFVEFFGPGLKSLTLPDRATLSNMCPEYGATAGFFPVDEGTLSYLRATCRPPGLIELAQAYLKAQGLFRTDDSPDPLYSDTVEFNLAHVRPSLAGPKRPQDRIDLARAKESFEEALPSLTSQKSEAPTNGELEHGAIVIAAITSCTNTSNPGVLMEAGLLAKKARALGLKTKSWVKTSLAPGSKVVVDYLKEAGLLRPLEELGFYLAGLGCTTCIGNSGPLSSPIEKIIEDDHLVVVSVLSGNRNFEGRIHSLVRANYLMSPPLVVAYALAGTMNVNLTTDPLGKSSDGKDVYLKDIWPTRNDVQNAVNLFVKKDFFQKEYSRVFEGNEKWKGIQVDRGERFSWDARSTYIRRASFLEKIPKTPGPVEDIRGARVLALLGDSVTTDHISPAGAIAEASPAGQYLLDNGVKREDFNSYGSRRGNHEVMVRGTFANGRLKNKLVPNTEGGVTKKFPEGTLTSIYNAAMSYVREKKPLLVVAGKEYGSGSSRDWAAKGTKMLGVRAVLAESFERIHRSNLIMMGVLPLQFQEGDNAFQWGLTGEETFDIQGLTGGLEPRGEVLVRVHWGERAKTHSALLRIDTPKEVEFYIHGGILPYVMRQLV